MFVPHARHRTVLPRAELGTASTFRQVSLGHMIRTVSSGIWRASVWGTYRTDGRATEVRDIRPSLLGPCAPIIRDPNDLLSC